MQNTVVPETEIKSIIRRNNTVPSERKDRLGNSFHTNSQKVTFIDKILGEPVKTVF